MDFSVPDDFDESAADDLLASEFEVAPARATPAEHSQSKPEQERPTPATESAATKAQRARLWKIWQSLPPNTAKPMKDWHSEMAVRRNADTEMRLMSKQMSAGDRRLTQLRTENENRKIADKSLRHERADADTAVEAMLAYWTVVDKRAQKAQRKLEKKRRKARSSKATAHMAVPSTVWPLEQGQTGVMADLEDMDWIETPDPAALTEGAGSTPLPWWALLRRIEPVDTDPYGEYLDRDLERYLNTLAETDGPANAAVQQQVQLRAAKHASTIGRCPIEPADAPTSPLDYGDHAVGHCISVFRQAFELAYGFDKAGRPIPSGFGGLHIPAIHRAVYDIKSFTAALLARLMQYRYPWMRASDRQTKYEGWAGVALREWLTRAVHAHVYESIWQMILEGCEGLEGDLNR